MESQFRGPGGQFNDSYDLEGKYKKNIKRLGLAATIGIASAIVFFILFVIMATVASKKKRETKGK